MLTALVVFTFLTGFTLGIIATAYTFVGLLKKSDDRAREARWMREHIDAYENNIHTHETSGPILIHKD